MSESPAAPPPFGEAGRCLKCGRPIAATETMCEVCNQAGMVAPAATQMHGTVAVAIVGAVALMAVVASLVVGDLGPFRAEVVRVGPVSEASVVIEVQVVNEGSRTGRARCNVTAENEAGSTTARVVTLSPPVEPGSSVSFEAQIPGLTTAPARVRAQCQ